jgi:hypothetical protein
MRLPKITRLALCLLPALAFLPTANANDGADVPGTINDMQSALTDHSWQLRVDNTPPHYCRDTYDFRTDNTLTIHSDMERIEAEWVLDKSAENAGFYMTEFYTAVNGKPDCQGDTKTSVGGRQTILMIPHESGSIRVCWTSGTANCFGWIDPMQDLIG